MFVRRFIFLRVKRLIKPNGYSIKFPIQGNVCQSLIAIKDSVEFLHTSQNNLQVLYLFFVDIVKNTTANIEVFPAGNWKRFESIRVKDLKGNS